MANRPKGLSAVGRLYRVLKRGTDQDGSKPALEVWAELFRMEPPGVTPSAVVAFGRLFELIVEALEEAKLNADLDVELFVHPLEQLAHELRSQSLNSRWTEIVNVYGKYLRPLAYCADRLDDRSPQLELGGDVLDQLRRTVEDLLQRLRDSDIEEPARSDLAARIEDLRTAIVHYSFAGAEPIKAAAAAATATAVIEKVRTNPSGTKWQLIRDVLLTAQAAFNVAEQAFRVAPQLAPAVTEVVRGLLGPGSQ